MTGTDYPGSSELQGGGERGKGEGAGRWGIALWCRRGMLVEKKKVLLVKWRKLAVSWCTKTTRRRGGEKGKA